jgi:hypothetical protein
MKIARLSTLGVRGLEDASYDFRHPQTGAPHDIVLVTGAAASGKTRLLEAIIAGKEGVAPYGMMLAPEPFLRGPGESAKIVITWYLSEDEARFAGVSGSEHTTEALLSDEGVEAEGDEGVLALLERYEHHERSGKLEYFPATRQVLPYGAGLGLSAIEQRLQRAGKDLRKYSFIPKLAASFAEDRQLGELFAARLATLGDVRYEPGTSEPWRGFRSAGRGLARAAVDVTELSASEADAVIFAATFTLLRLDHSIAMIDRPELHTDPSLQLAYMKAIARLGSDTQLLLATSSAALIGAVDPSQVTRLA